MHRLYENDDIVIFWNSEMCQHAAECVKGSPETFNPMQRPWIDMSRAGNAEIWQAVERCPSRALSCLYRHEIDVVLDSDGCRSVAYDGDAIIGECDYEKSKMGWNIYHTEVLPSYGGKGIAKRLVYKLLEVAEREKVEIKATCSYAAKIINEG